MSSVVGRPAFSQLHSDGHRYRSGPIRCRFIATGDRPRRAFAIGRKFGTAVQRNRARRRIDAALDIVARDHHIPEGDYLFACSSAILHLEFAELVQNAEHMFATIDRAEVTRP